MVSGQQIGSLGGAAGATALGVPAPVGGAVGGIIGGLFDKSNNKEPRVLREDPNQISRLREIDSTRRQISQGRDPLVNRRVENIRKTGETTKSQLGKFTGGDVGGTISSFLRAQRNTDAGVNDAFTQSQNRLPFFENLSTQLGNRISQRKLELDINTQDTARAQNANSDKAINQSISGLIGNLGQGVGQPQGSTFGGFGGGSTPPGAISLGGGGGGIDSLGASSPGLESLFQSGISGGGGGLGSGFGGF